MQQAGDSYLKRGPVWTVALLDRDYMDNRDLSPLPQLNCMSVEDFHIWMLGVAKYTFSDVVFWFKVQF